MSQTGNVLGKAIGAGLNAMFSSSPSSAAPANSAQQTYDLMSAKPGSDQDVYNHMTGANTMVNAPLQTTQQQTEGDQSADNSDATPGNNMAKGGKVPAMVSPGEKYLKPQDVEKVKRGANPMKVGETIPGKPRVGGAKNSYANDTVPKTLDEGGIVLPRSVTQSKNPEWAAHRFVKAYMAQGGKVALPKKAKK